MTYFNLNQVTNPPNDEFVNPITQINNNFQDINDKIKGFNVAPNTITGAPLGTEAFYVGSPSSDATRIAVWNGSAWCRSLNHSSVWTGWQTVTLRAPVVIRAGYPVMANVDPVSRRIVFVGAVQADAAANAWPLSDVEITSDTAIASSFAPTPGGNSYTQVATGQVTTGGFFAGAVIRAHVKTTPTRLALTVKYQGNAGGLNYVTLDGLTWWY